MERIVIRGTSGSGKSTLGARLSRLLDIPVVELDDHWHLPGWQTRPVEDFRARVEGLTQGDRWIVVGNYRTIQDLVLPRADTLLWLDYPFGLTLYRVVKRTIRRYVRQELCCNGNRESLRKSLFTRDSIIWWTITTHARRHRQAMDLLADAQWSHLQRWRFSQPRELEDWLGTYVTKPVSSDPPSHSLG